MKYIIILFFAIMSSCTKNKIRNQNSQHLYKYTLVNNKWISSGYLGLNPKLNIVKLIKFQEKKFMGVLVNFSDNNFLSYNISPCGNDHFTKIQGRHQFYDKNKVAFFVDSISYYGEYKKSTEYRKDVIDYKILKKGDTLILIKI